MGASRRSRRKLCRRKQKGLKIINHYDYKSNLNLFIQGTVLKKYSLQEEECYKELMQDNLMRAVPRFFQTVEIDGESESDIHHEHASITLPLEYMELCCCLSDFKNPSIMDIKMGVRTFVESEVLSNSFYNFVWKYICLRHP